MTVSPFIREAVKYEPSIRKALINLWNELRNQWTTTQIEKAFFDRGIEGVLELYDNLPAKTAKFIDPIIDDAIRSGAALATETIPAGAFLTTDISVSLMTPVAINFLQNYKFNLIQTISSNTLEAMRNSLIADVTDGVNPLTTARRFRNNLGLTPNQEQAVRNYRKYLEEGDPTALQRKLRDRRFDSTIQRAIDGEKALTKAQIEKMTNRYRERYIKYRSEVIARTESLRAITIGNRAAIEQMLMNGEINIDIVRRFWRYTRDSKTRIDHRRIPSLNPEGRKLNEPFLTPAGSLMYPRDPNGLAADTVQCRCVEYYRLIEEE